MTAPPRSSAECPPGYRPVVTLYVVWHPEATVAAELAQSVFLRLCGDPDYPAIRGLGIPVRFRTALAAAEVPTAIPFGGSGHSVVLILADDCLCASPAWSAWVNGLVDSQRPSDLVIPVALASVSVLPARLAARQAIRLQGLSTSQQATVLLRDAMHDICRVLEPSAGKVRVFLSHAKGDGLAITTEVRRYLHEEARIDDFFDAADIPDGASFATFLSESAGSLPVLLAVQTDTYASREWCRLEVLEAKRKGVPLVVLTALEKGEARSFPYLGNVPVVRWLGDASLPEVAQTLIAQVLRNRYFPLRVRAVCDLCGAKEPSLVLTSPPELFTLVGLDSGQLVSSPGMCVYPDPPLGTEELGLLRLASPTFDPVTPTVLLAQ